MPVWRHCNVKFSSMKNKAGFSKILAVDAQCPTWYDEIWDNSLLSDLCSTFAQDDVIIWKLFRVTVPLWRELTSGFPLHRPVTRSFDVFFDLRLNTRLGKQWRRRWFETPSRLSWRHCNELALCTTRCHNSSCYNGDLAAFEFILSWKWKAVLVTIIP